MHRKDNWSGVHKDNPPDEPTSSEDDQEKVKSGVEDNCHEDGDEPDELRSFTGNSVKAMDRSTAIETLPSIMYSS